MSSHKVWDPLLRIFYWSLVGGFTANALLIDGEADLHEINGYAILGLIGFRMLWGVIGPRYARFASFPPDPAAAFGQAGEMLRGDKKVHFGHSPLGALMIYDLLLSILAIVVTGWLLTTSTFWGVAWVEDAHEALVSWAELSVVVLVAAVVLESLRLDVNLPKAMLTGYKTFRANTPEL